MFSTSPTSRRRWPWPCAAPAPHDAGDDARAAHVHRHVFHARRGLDRDAAGVEHDALADQREGRLAFPAPCHCITTTLDGLSDPCPTPSSARIPSFSSSGSSSTSTSRPSVLHRQGGPRNRRRQHVRRRVDEVAGEEHAFGQRRRIRGRCRLLLGLRRHEGEARGAGVVVILARLHLGVAVGAQHRAKGDVAHPTVGAHDREHRLAARRPADRGPRLARLGRGRTGVELHDLQRLGREARRVGQVPRVARRHLREGLAVDETLERAAHQPVQPPANLVELARMRDGDRDAPLEPLDLFQRDRHELQRSGRRHGQPRHFRGLGHT
jgi:hypothetical protein